ncbi:MAG: hypothetical protein COT24_03365 [Candidatus Kerfeldbacteria bacterium CG08_land_8_20_14_0_20_40_16]|uniref:Type II secretion system protein J n=1 Tax=Candidatus Kerfeldbacteria bacterium CG08_land_8_20_14_0_20_40_16 TaxID=2014244 RepID=A0A2H0YVD5_9BACT|nr:MAG: hypothetical protein COT24_03365 [Candidatus Kerfeldbacteria bacterium CG08_land_8_20_14_0_20_40_16]
MFRQHKISGFTLIEMIIVMGIIGIVGTIVYQFIVQGNRVFTQSRDQALAQDTLRKVMDSLAKELRKAQNADNGAYLLEGAQEQSIIFYADIDNDGDRERIRYFLDGIDFKKGVVEPTVNPVEYPSENEVISPVVTNVRNQGAIFTYFDENYTGTEDPFPYPINLNEVKLVHLKFIVDVEPNFPPDPISIETSVMIRNLKTNL